MERQSKGNTQGLARSQLGGLGQHHGAPVGLLVTSAGNRSILDQSPGLRPPVQHWLFAELQPQALVPANGKTLTTSPVPRRAHQLGSLWSTHQGEELFLGMRTSAAKGTFVCTLSNEGCGQGGSCACITSCTLILQSVPVCPCLLRLHH